jgi:hypothetical protein
MLQVLQLAVFWSFPNHFSCRKCMSCDWRSRGCRKSVKRWLMKWTWTWIHGCHLGRQMRSFTRIFTLDSRVSFFPHHHDVLHPVSHVNYTLLLMSSHFNILVYVRNFLETCPHTVAKVVLSVFRIVLTCMKNEHVHCLGEIQCRVPNGFICAFSCHRHVYTCVWWWLASVQMVSVSAYLWHIQLTMKQR